VAQLEEEITLNAIKSRVAQSRLEFRSNERNADYVPSGKRYLDVLNAAIDELIEWEANINSKIEQHEIPRAGRPPITTPKRDDPRFKLLADTIPFIIEVRQERDELEGWLETQEESGS
jgi:hypothetical protein